jgi:hypothetical protein
MLRAVVQTIGTPFNPPQHDRLDGFGAMDLYYFARNNKIGLLFLEALPENALVGEIRAELKQQREYNRNLKLTALRMAGTLNKVNCKYAIIKSHFPFPAVPADVDLIVFGDDLEYNRITSIISGNDFDQLGEAPLELLFHDMSRGISHGDPTSKDAFDVDVYKEIGAGRIIYMNKKNIVDQVNLSKIDGQDASMLKPPGEIAVSIFHSIFPERIFTLLLYYQIVFAITQMSKADIDDFIRICKDNKMKTAGRIVLSICEKIHELSFEEPLTELVRLREELGSKVHINLDKIPYNYPNKLILDAFWGKRGDHVFMVSFARQLVSMINPRYAKYVLSIHRHRKKRDTY